MSSSPFFSVILPTFNRAQFIAIAIESVLNQTYPNWELIIVDDGSTDSTAALVTRFEDKRIQYVYQENAERSAARNNGISKSTGNYVCFIDSDDEFDPKHLEFFHNAIIDTIENDCIFVAKSVAVDFHTKKESRLVINIGNTDKETVLLNSITPGQLCVPSLLIKEINFNPAVSISEDTELLIRLVDKAKLYILDVFTFRYMLHIDNSVNSNRYNAFLARKKTLELIFSYPETAQVSRELKRKILSNCYFGIYRYHKGQGNFMQSKWIMIESILRYPTQRLKEKLYLLVKG